MPQLLSQRVFPPLLFCILLISPALSCRAAEQQAKALPPGSAVEKSLAQDFPQVLPDLEGIYPTPVEGLFEVQTGRGLVYYFPASSHILVGQLVDKTGRNLTRDSAERQMAEKLAQIPLDQALEIGSGANTVIEFTDPDCPYCRKAAKFWAERDDVTRYIFFFPLKTHPQAEPKARYILAAEDPAQAYEEVMAGKYDQAPLPEFEDSGRLERQLQIGRQIGIRSTPTFWVNGTFVSGADIDLFRQLLEQRPAETAAPPAADSGRKE